MEGGYSQDGGSDYHGDQVKRKSQPGLLSNLVGGLFGRNKSKISTPAAGGTGPVKLSALGYSDDFRFCKNFDDLNIAITGATGTIGSIVLQTIIEKSRPKKLALFCRDEEKLPSDILELCRVSSTDPSKFVYSYEVDFVDALKITNKTHAMLRHLEGSLDVIIFCHGVINFMGGVDGNLPEWDLI